MLLWLDLETTGLDPQKDRILEIAWTLTHSDLSPLLHTIRTYVLSPAGIANHPKSWNPVVQRMHEETGLLAEMQGKGLLRREAVEDQLMTDIARAHLVVDEPVYLAGASVHFDLAFMRFWMPRVSNVFSHRVYDTSTLKAFFESLGIEHSVVNVKQHRAINDVHETLAVAREYRDVVSRLLTSSRPEEGWATEPTPESMETSA